MLSGKRHYLLKHMSLLIQQRLVVQLPTDMPVRGMDKFHWALKLQADT